MSSHEDIDCKKDTINNIRISHFQSLPSPKQLIDEVWFDVKLYDFIANQRQQIEDIISGLDLRLLVVVGPCSIHNVEEAKCYAQKLLNLAQRYKKRLCIVMRVYFEKPRTTVGWKGLINDPYLNNSLAIHHGLKLARSVLVDINQMGLGCATEFLDTIIPQFISDLVCWGAIGARTVESQLHRELASGLSMPVGFKNATRGDIQVAVDACLSASHPHTFLSISLEGKPVIVHTCGNKATHVILRGGQSGPNYHSSYISRTESLLKNANLNNALMIDCSHGNSAKDYRNQANVLKSIAQAIALGNKSIIGVMLESNLVAGHQAVKPFVKLKYGQSITDSCIGFSETEHLLAILNEAMEYRFSA